MKKTQEEINSEIAKLEELLPKVRSVSFFGDDNRAAIKAQITALKKGLTFDQCYDKFSDDYARSNAQDAVSWRDGDEPDDDYTPSSEWLGLVRE